MATATVRDAIQEIVDELRNVRDIKSAPNEPTENLEDYPFVTVIPSDGVFEKQSYGWQIGLININIELHVARHDLPYDFIQVVDLLDEIPRQLESGLQNDRFSIITTWGDNISFRFGELQWANITTLGVVYTIENVKLINTIS